MLGVRVPVVASLMFALWAGPAAAAQLGYITEYRTGLHDSRIAGLTAGPDHDVWFTDHGKHPAIGRITPTGEITEFSVGLQAKSSPQGIAAGPDGNLWFTNAGKHPAIGRITPTGEITEFSAGLLADNASDPGAITAGPDGNLWFADLAYDVQDPRVGQITPSGQITEFELANGDSHDLGGIAAGPDGNLWLAESNAVAIGRITPNGQLSQFTTDRIPDSNGAPNPVDITAGPDGDMWAVLSATGPRSDVVRVTTDGTVTKVTSAFQPANNSTLANIAAGPDGNLWLTEDGWLGPSVDRMTPQGHVTAFTQGLAMLGASKPGAITKGDDGDMWFADNGPSPAIGRITTAGPAPAGRLTPVITCPQRLSAFTAPLCSIEQTRRPPAASSTAATLITGGFNQIMARGPPGPVTAGL